jgi:hypothetical protein
MLTESIVSDIQQQPSQAQKALEVARQRLGADGFATDNLKVQTVEGNTSWTFYFLPSGRVRGGGAEVVVSRHDLSVSHVVYLQ